ncbi:ABC transporter permease subunit [Musicola keenii]|uniref:ABC transporter permease subunit n=1 Tax=Musicola keenii TaxID=2884250 RepID=UPI0017855B93|nr:ABC transporter permease subunit [Musicola keenii]
MADTGRLPYRDKRRALIDRLTHRIVVGSGWLVLLALLLIFFYLLYVVIPLFFPPSIHAVQEVTFDDREPAVALGISDDGQTGFRLDRHGNGEWISLTRGQRTARLPLMPEVVLTASSIDERPLLALGHPDGSVSIVQPDMSQPAGATPQWRFPLGSRPLTLDGDAAPLRLLAIAHGDDGPRLAVVTQDNQLRWYLPGAAGMTPGGRIALDDVVGQLLLAPDGQQLYTLSERRLTVWEWRGSMLSIRETLVLPGTAPFSLSLLAGGHSLLINDANGVLSQWFDTPTENGMRLTAARHFPVAEPPFRLIVEPRRRVFATLTPAGAFSLFASKQPGALLTAQLASSATLAAFSLHGRALLIESPQGWHTYQLDNAYPDIGWRGLWQKLWYENYPHPDYVWQPTAADDSYQAKFSLTPLLAGTLKAAFYAMLFATPLALAAAVYTACFMAPTLRRWVKPTMEIMGALPTVVIGLIAALWLAPQMADYLASLLLLPVLWTLAVLACGWWLDRLPACWRRRLPTGWDAMLLIPAMLLMLATACWLGPRLEMALLGQPLWQWLGDGFSQRNALVAGVALGFALIPLIFSLAEDALFSVPAALSQGSLALGATAWQTLWRVILPSASSGIFAALMLSFGRAVGETMIVLMATGNTPVMDNSLLQGLRSLAANIAIEMPEAAMASGHYRVLFFAALALFIFTFVVNTLAETIRQRLRRRYRDEGEQA